MNSIFGDLKMTTQQRRILGLVLIAVGSYILVLLLNKFFATSNTTLIKTIGYWIMFQLPGMLWLLIQHDKQQTN